MSSSEPSPVLVIDDNVDDLFVMRQRLLRAGIENPILSFEDGEEAMAHLKRAIGHPDAKLPSLIFLDLRMPRRGGFDVLKWIRAQPTLSDIPVFIVSTSSLPEDAARAQQLGASGFLGKFPTPEALAEIVRSKVDGRRK